MFYIVLLVYLFLAFVYRKKALVLIMLLLQVVSVIAAIVIQYDDLGYDQNTLFSLLTILICTVSIILPWDSLNKIQMIECNSISRLNKLTNLLLWLSGFTFLVLLVVAVVVNITVSDINAFKYEGDTAMEFYYSMLPFNVKFFILALYLYYLSYFLLPLHFYYLCREDKRKALLCLLFSTNIILYGMAFFSRWTIVEYLMYYVAMRITFDRFLPKETKNRKQKRRELLYIGIGVLVFLLITISRFSDNIDIERKIESSSPIQNPVVYSFFDYLGQSNHYGIKFLNSYNGQTFQGDYALSATNTFLSALGLTKKTDYHLALDTLWDNFHGFPGWTAYTIYDVGYIGTILVLFIYILLVSVKRRSLPVSRLLLLSCLIQIPLCAIFYSKLSQVIFLCFIYLFIYLFLNFNVDRNYEKSVLSAGEADKNAFIQD